MCQESGSVALPPNSTAIQQTDTVPAPANSASAFLEPLSASDLATFDSTWDDVVYIYPNLSGVKSTPLRRAITCAVMARASAATVASAYQVQEQGQIAGNDLYAAFLSICIQVTVLGQQNAGSAAAAGPASAGCAQANVSVPFLVSRTRTGYLFKLTGRTSKAKVRGPLAISCRTKGKGIQVSIKSRSRRRHLRQIVGPHLRLGFSNPTNRSLTIRTTFRIGP